MGWVELELPNGTKAHGHVCVRGERRKRCAHVDLRTGECCTSAATLLCDHQVGKGRDGSERTCDRPCCAKHAQNVGPDRDLCLEHAPQNAPTFAELDERLAGLKRELSLANDARDWSRFCAAERELAQLLVRRSALTKAVDAEAWSTRLDSTKRFLAIATVAIEAMPQTTEDTQCRLF